MDEPASSSLLTIACRLIPQDQWLLTHVDPSWKTKQLKLWLLSKCFTCNVPVVDLPRSRRPPSPITFAPDPRHRPISPITFASASPAPRASSNSFNDSDDTDADSTWDSPAPSDDEERVTPLFEPRLRPRTHLYSPPSTRTLQQESASPAFSHNPTTSSTAPRKEQHQKVAVRRLDSIDNVGESYTLIRFSTGQTLEDDFNVSWYNIYPYELLEIHRSGLIVSLPRELSLYIQPYFEAKVMALRVVWQRPSRHAAEEVSKRRTRLEWRERWVIIKDGNLNLCRRLTDTSPSHHLPLKDLLALRGAAQLERTLSVAEDQRIICIKFRVDSQQNRTRTTSNQPVSPSIAVEQEPASPYSPIKHPTGPSYAYAFAGGSSRKAKNPGKLKKHELSSGSSSKATLLPEHKTPSSSKSLAPTPSPSANSMASSISQREAETIYKPTSSGNLRLPRIKTTNASKGKPAHTATTLRKAQDNSRPSTSKQNSWKQGVEPDDIPPFDYTPPDAPDNTFNPSELESILNIRKTDESSITEEDEEADNFSTLSSPVFAAPPSPLYAPPSSLFNNIDFDGDENLDEQEEQGNEAVADVDDERVSDPPWAFGEERSTVGIEDESASAYKGDEAGLPQIQSSNLIPEAGEWVVLDMVEDDAFHSILRILHRHFPSPISSSFINPQSMAMMDTPIETPTSPVRDPASASMESQTEENVWDDTSSRKSSVLTSSSLPNSPLSTSNSYFRDTPRRTRSQSPGVHPESLKFSFSSSGRNSDSLHRYPNRTTRLAPVPYPEWRTNIVRRARSAGLGSVGKALEYVQRQADASPPTPPQRQTTNGSRGAGFSSRPRRRHRRDDDSLAVDSVAPSLDYHFGASDPEDDDIIASPLSPKHSSMHRGKANAHDDANEDEDGSQLDGSEVEWRGWQRDLPRQLAVQQGRIGRTRPVSRGSFSSDGEQDTRESHISVEKAFSANPLHRQRDRIALEPTAQVVSLPQVLPTHTASSSVPAVRPLPSPPPTAVTTIQSPPPSASGHTFPIPPLTVLPSAPSDTRHPGSSTGVPPIISPTEPVPSISPYIKASPQVGCDVYAKPGSSSVTSSPTPFTPAYGSYGSWKTDMGVRLRVQEPLHRKRDTANQLLPTGRLAFRSQSFFPASPQHSLVTPSISQDVSPPPMLKVSPPSISSQSGVLPSNKLSHGPSISRRSSPGGYPPELKRKISAGKPFLPKKDSAESDLGIRTTDSDRSLEGPSSSGVQDLRRERTLQETDFTTDRYVSPDKGRSRAEESPLFSPELSSKKQRPKLSLSTSHPTVGASPSKIRTPIPPPQKSNLLRHTKSKSKDLSGVPRSPPPSSARPDATQSSRPGTQDKPVRRKGFVSLGADKLLTGFEPALDFVGGR